LFSIASDFATMDVHAPATHIPGYSRARLKHIIATGNIAAIVIGLWIIFFPTHLYKPALALCILLPLLGLALDMRARGVLGFEARRHGRYPLSLATILMLPALELAVRAGIDLNFESYPPLIAAAVLTALAMFVVFWRFDPQVRGDVNQCTTIAIFAVVYSYGVLAFADVVLDPSLGHDTQTVIDHKRVHVSGGPKGSSVWYQVKVDPEASPAGANWIHVQPDLWDSFQRGDTVCVHFSTGLLAIPWYAVRHCGD
jgi:hypothetical protein